MSIELYVGEQLADTVDKTIRLRVTEHLVQTIATARLIGRKSFEYKALPEIYKSRTYYGFIHVGDYLVYANYLGKADNPITHRDWLIKLKDFEGY